jgi:hypothetical protein
VVLALLATGSAPAAPAEDVWAPYRFLIGEWVGEGSGQPGKGTGGFSFAPDLQGKILVRRNRAEYPATAARPAVTHEDLMIVYPGAAGERTRAVYFDSEGHVIHYTLAFSEDQRTLTFLSDAAPSAPRYRLSYTKREGESVAIKFEIAPAGKPDAFRTYIEATARRKEAGKPERSRPEK